MCLTKVLSLIVNVKEFNTHDVQAISRRYSSIELQSNIKVCFCLDDITDVQNSQGVIIVTVSNFVNSRTIKIHQMETARFCQKFLLHLSCCLLFPSARASVHCTARFC